jgi:hypothetical protein
MRELQHAEGGDLPSVHSVWNNDGVLMNRDSKPVARLLQVMAEEFPAYHRDGHSLQEACLAVTAVAGALGAHLLDRGNDESLQKFIRLLQTQTEHFAHGAHARLRDERSKMQ